MERQSQFPLFVAPQARKSDPDTSKQNESVDLVDRDTGIVRQIMSDGVARSDQEIYTVYIAEGLMAPLSPDRIRHGRFALSNTGELVETGERRRTTNGGSGRVWRRR